MSNPVLEYNIIVAEKVFSKPLNRDIRYAAKFGSRYPKGANNFLSGTFPSDEEWVENIRKTRDEMCETVILTNEHSVKIGNGDMPIEDLKENMVYMLEVIKNRFRDIDEFSVTCGEDTFKFDFDLDTVEVKYPMHKGKSKRKAVKS